MKIITVLGARPQFVKAAALSRAIQTQSEIKEIIIHTGQHYDTNMSGIFFDQMQIPKPEYSLNIASKHHGQMTGRMIEEIEKILIREQPDMVLTYGDTNSTLAAALAAKKLHLRIGHVEAGLRSYNMKMPEEVNRIITDRISDLLFCPGPRAIENLMKEGFNQFPGKIFDVGDIMKDVAYFYKHLEIEPPFFLPANFVLATIHRAENTDHFVRLKSIFEALINISQDLPIVLPLHPRTRSKLNSLTIDIPSSVIIIEPIGYLEMVYLLKRCSLVITDSGGLQKEAYFFGKGCVTTRDETEWSELVDAGYNLVVGANAEKILSAKNYFLSNAIQFTRDLYGDGNTAQKIVSILNGIDRQ
jgi:UDP-GlcNAc3NAcA epimerase